MSLSVTSRTSNKMAESSAAFLAVVALVFGCEVTEGPGKGPKAAAPPAWRFNNGRGVAIGESSPHLGCGDACFDSVTHDPVQTPRTNHAAHQQRLTSTNPNFNLSPQFRGGIPETICSNSWSARRGALEATGSTEREMA